MCFSSKKKYEVRDPKKRVAPVSETLYSAVEYKPINLVNKTGYMLAKESSEIESDKVDRLEDYGKEFIDVEQPKLFAQKELLDYDLDSPAGVSKIHLVPTFFYSSSFTHCFFPDPQTKHSENESEIMIKEGFEEEVEEVEEVEAGQKGQKGQSEGEGENKKEGEKISEKLEAVERNSEKENQNSKNNEKMSHHSEQRVQKKDDDSDNKQIADKQSERSSEKKKNSQNQFVKDNKSSNEGGMDNKEKLSGEGTVKEGRDD